MNTSPRIRPEAAPADRQADAVSFIETGGLGGDVAQRIDTHAASIFLVGDRAWKMKRAVHLDYLDFSRLELRKAALETALRSEEHTSELQSLMRISYAVFCLKKKTTKHTN